MSVTDFMMNLHKELIEKRGVTESTASQILRSLVSLNNGKPFKNLAWSRNVDSVSARLNDYAESTQKTMISNLVSALSLFKENRGYKKIQTVWYNAMMDKVQDGK